ncbi:MAG: MATE family efflux transporter [Leptolyngbyaceae bacterium]|nr:MATE family efflux transporter [Leptolyngbyaceae bacterium]
MMLPKYFRDELKACLSLSIPLASAQLAQSMNGFVDTVMMGTLGSQYLAAGGLGATTFMFLLLINTGLLSAVSPIASEAHGRGDADRVAQSTVQGLWVALLISIPVTVLLGHSAPLLRVLGQEEEIVVLSASYLRAIALGYFPALVFVVLRNFVSALSRPQSVMIIMVAGVGLNAIANYALIYGAFGLPALGLVGVGWASTVSFWAMSLALGVYVFGRSPFKMYRIWHRLTDLQRQLLQEILRVGLPIAILSGFETGLFSLTTFLAGHFGAPTLAAHQIALQTAAICFMVPFGVSQATTVRVGQFIGQRQPLAARRAGYAGVAIGAVFMALMAVFIMTLPRLIISFYVDVNDPQNQEVITIAAGLLGVAAMFQIFDGVQVTTLGALRGIKDTRIPMGIGMVAYWGVGFTTGYITGFHLGMGGVGLWLGLAVGLGVAAIALIWRFHHLMLRAECPQASPQSIE